jgi:FKBP-type peptidyl-prolyl cis-trans isomerase FkpA
VKHYLIKTYNLIKSIKVLLPLILVLILACSRSEYSDYSKTESGLLYKIHIDNDGNNAKIGDFLTVEMTYYTNEDSMLFDSKGKTFPLRLEKPVFAGDINEALSTIGKGDSATFVIRADSFLVHNAKVVPLPAFVNDNSKIIFHVKIHNIQTLQELEEEEKRKIQQAKELEEQKISEYLMANEFTLEAESSGLYFISTKKGEGSVPKTGQTVVIHYKGKFLDGTIFDNSFIRGKPLEFKIGYGQVISGLDFGVARMKKGGEAKLLIPSYLGYGEGRAEIPPFTPLLFEVKLIDIK